MNRKLVLYIAGAVLAGIIAGAGGMWLINQAQSPHEQKSPTPTPSASPTPTESSIKPSGSNAELSDCATADLNVSFVEAPGGAAAGSVYYLLKFENAGSQKCTMRGFPGVSLVDNDGNQIGSPAGRETMDDLEKVELDPNEIAQAQVRVVNNNFDNGVCKQGATKLRVYPPNQTAYRDIPVSLTTWCPGFSVTSVGAPS